MNLNIPESMSFYSTETETYQEKIKDVWDYNLYQEAYHVMEMAHKYPYIAMDTEFPGLVTRQDNYNIFVYKTLRDNVNQLKIIQLGITFCDEDGKVPSECPTWQFNFKFDINKDKYNDESIGMLTNAGVDFNALALHGIDPLVFSEVMTMSGLVMNPQLSWISFHSGYDFGYLLRLFMNYNLPETKEEFYKLLRIYFPRLYDIKHMIIKYNKLQCSLSKLAEKFNIIRIGQQHQAGSDSLLTANTFFKVRKELFKNNIDEKYIGILQGVEDEDSPSLSTLTNSVISPNISILTSPTHNDSISNSNDSITMRNYTNTNERIILQSNI